MAEKVIGILGGMGPEATLDCFEKIIRNTPAGSRPSAGQHFVATDQRGETRPQMGGFDIGAFELCLVNPLLGLPCTIVKPVARNLFRAA